MKRLIILTLAFCLLLSACSALVPSQYVRVSEHSAAGEVTQNADVLSARDFASLKDAIRSFVKSGIEHGVIRVQSYAGGDVEEDLSTAAYQVAREDPYGAYMVDYMTHSCSLIVSYYEIGIDITFRQDIASPDELAYVTSASNAQSLIRRTMDSYGDTEREKVELLFTYLMERFSYVARETSTPVYSHLCDGLTSSKSAAQSWQLLCDKIGLECVTVSGLYQGSEHWWNILSLDGTYCHVDTFRDLLESGELHTWSDADMTDYYWDTAQYPACVRPEPETPPEDTEPSAPEQPGELPFDPEEELPSGEEPSPEAPTEPETPPETPSESPDGKFSDYRKFTLDFFSFSAIITPAFEMRV